MKKRKNVLRFSWIFRYLFYLYWILFMICVGYSRIPPRFLFQVLQDKRIQTFQDQRTYFSEISDFVVLDERIYVLYGRIGVLEVYAQDGAYEKSYVVYCGTLLSSNLHLDTDGKYVWMTGNEDNCFLFQNGEFMEEKSRHDYNVALYGKTILERDSSNRMADGTIYKRKGPSICRITPEGMSETVIRRPLYCLLVQGALPFLLHILVIACLVLFHFLLKNRQGRTVQIEDRPKPLKKTVSRE